MKIIAIIFSACLLLACNEAGETPGATTPTQMVIIDVQPFSDLPKKDVTAIYEQLRNYCPSISLKKPIDLPQTAYYTPRKRYRADSLINYLRMRTTKGHVTMGLTSMDISHTKGKINDYGIMGLAYQPGSAGVVSSFRISKTNTLEQFCKLTLHELGHTQGLPHCKVSNCLMRDAEGKNHMDEENDFCTSCKTRLTAAGWTFN